MSRRPQDAVYPPCPLDAGRAQWTARDKLARLVAAARLVGYGGDCGVPEFAAEERALFNELAALLEELEPLHGELARLR